VSVAVPPVSAGCRWSVTLPMAGTAIWVFLEEFFTLQAYNTKAALCFQALFKRTFAPVPKCSSAPGHPVVISGGLRHHPASHASCRPRCRLPWWFRPCARHASLASASQQATGRLVKDRPSTPALAICEPGQWPGPGPTCRRSQPGRTRPAAIGNPVPAPNADQDPVPDARRGAGVS